MILLNSDNRRYFVDVFNNWVANVRIDYDPLVLGVGNIRPYSYFGSVQDIVNYLIEKSGDPITSRQKFPFVCLVDNFKEKIDSVNTFYEVNPTIYIFHESLENYNPQQRYTNVIKPVLYPIFDCLIRWIEYSQDISPVNDSLVYTKELFRGQIGDNVQISDTVDCLKITFDNIKIKNNC